MYKIKNITKYTFVLCLSFTFLQSSDTNSTLYYTFPNASTNDPVAALVGTALIGLIYKDKIIKDIKNNYKKPLSKDFKYLEEFEKNIIKVKKEWKI